MEANKLNLAKIFTSYTLYKVPFYQRSYVWEEDKWSRFLNDMYYVSSIKKNYFLGSIILKQESTSTGSVEERIIIDGQQRFTTILLFFKSFSLKNLQYKDEFKHRFFNNINNKVCLEHSLNDIADFSEVINLDKDEPISKTNPSKIIQAYNFFQQNLDPDKVDYHILINNLTLIGIDLNQEDDEQMIFDTINSLSEPLTTGELLKNYFFKEDAREEYEELWRPVFEQDSETVDFWNNVITQGRLGKTNIDAFFNAMLQIKIHNKSIPGMTYEYRNRIKRTDRLFRNYKELISDFNLDKKDFIYELIDYAELFKNNLSQEIELEELPGYPCIERINFIIKFFDCSTMVPYILYILRNVKEEDERNKIYGYLENYILRRVIAKSNNNNFSDLFSENLIGGNILTCDALREYIENKGPEQSLAMPNDQSIRMLIRENEQNNKRSLAILYMLETRMRFATPHSTTVFPFDAYSLEHIMPKKWMKHWNVDRLSEFDDNMREHYIKTLGNHTLLNSKLNTSISNASWNIKLNGNAKGRGIKEYASGLETIKTILNSEEWNEIEILNRADWLAEKVNKIWCSFLSSQEQTDSDEEILADTLLEKKNSEENNEANSNDLNQTIKRLESKTAEKLIQVKKNVLYSEDEKSGYIYSESKVYKQGDRKKFWYGFRKKKTQQISNCPNKYMLYAFKGTNCALRIPMEVIENCLPHLNTSIGDDGQIAHWHFVFFLDNAGHVTQLLSNPVIKEIDMDKYKI